MSLTHMLQYHHALVCSLCSKDIYVLTVHYLFSSILAFLIKLYIYIL